MVIKAGYGIALSTSKEIQKHYPRPRLPSIRILIPDVKNLRYYIISRKTARYSDNYDKHASSLYQESVWNLKAMTLYPHR